MSDLPMTLERGAGRVTDTRVFGESYSVRTGPHRMQSDSTIATIPLRSNQTLIEPG